MLVASACGASGPSTGVVDSQTAAPPTTGSPSAAATSGAPSGTTPGSSATPGHTPAATPGATASPPAAPTDGSAPPSASGMPSPSVSLACNPRGNSTTFWPQTASSVTWAVYCAVLPKGWYVKTGNSHYAGGGSLTITYAGPAGATVSLSEGSFCTDGSGCVPSGTAAGDAMFGDLNAALVSTDSGGFAIVAAQGETPSWLMVTTGLDQPTTLAFGAALARVGG